MCGILGIVARPGRKPNLDRAAAIAMRDAMTPRGPDGCGLFQRRNVVFGHRRLAIRDLHGGRQPWVSDDGACVLVYNGEIYNDVPLRQELAARGHRFRSRCDTEVVLAAYRQWGRDCVQRLRGMFAFGIYDFRDDSLLLARDRFGIKPLYYSEHGGCLTFASTVAALLKHPAAVKSPDWPAVGHYLSTFRTTLGRRTLYSGIYQLEPGELLFWQGGQGHIERYWDYPDEDESPPSYTEAAQLLESLLHEAVQLRLVADVPVGMFLSGGVDSNTIACLMRGLSPGRIMGVCGGAAGTEFDDFPSARRCAQHAGCDYQEVRLSAGQYLERWRELLRTGALPLSTPTDVILFELARQAKRTAGVVLGGEGADELLCGYAIAHWAGCDYDRQQQLVQNRWPASPSAARVFHTSLLRQYGRDRFESQADHYLAANSLMPRSVKPALYHPQVWKEMDQDRPVWDYYARLFEQLGEAPTPRKHAVVLHRVNLEGLLGRLDGATMSAGLEARVPFTDHRLVEAMFRLPVHYKIGLRPGESPVHWCSADLERRGSLESKRLLRTVAQRLMPHSLAARKKASFPTPVAAWMSGPWRRWVRFQLLDSPFGKTLFQDEARAHLADRIDQLGLRLWPILNIVAWGDREF